MDPTLAAPDEWYVNTVTGPVAAADLGYILAHEHVCVDHRGPRHQNYLDIDWESASRRTVDALKALRADGVTLIVDWTAIGMGRNALFLRDVSRRSGMHIACASGVGTGALPPALGDATIDRLSEVFVDELEKGIENTSITAAFIKVTSMDGGPTSAERRILAAAAVAASATGAALGIHALDMAAIKGALSVVESDRLDLRQVIWGHAEFASPEDQRAAADLGMTLQFDGMAVSRPAPYALEDPEQKLLEQVEQLVERGFTDQVLIANDASILRVPDAAYAGDPGILIRDFAPALAKRLGSDVADRILKHNPIEVFGHRVGPRSRRPLPPEIY